MKWTRESALAYLAHRKLLTKPASEYTTAYAKRVAASAQKQEQAGKEFSRKEARGKKPKQTPERPPQRKEAPKERRIVAPIEYYPRNREKHILEQWRVMRPQFKRKSPQQLQEMDKTTFMELFDAGRELDHGDIQRLYDRTPGGKKSLFPTRERIYLGITGIGQDSARPGEEEEENPEPEPEAIHTYAFPVTRKAIAAWLTNAPKQDADDILSFARMFSNLEWSYIFGVSFAYPESW